jgi:hypothetical protein
MTRTFRRAAAAFCSLAALAVGAPAFAQSSSESIAGNWLFDTSEFSGDCVIKGRINFQKAQGAPNAYTCTFESEQVCGPEYYNMYIKVKQSCVAQKVGKQVAITSQVTKIEEARADIPGFETSYLADNFVVSLTKSMLEMVGDHYDEQRELKARFWRDVDLVS